MNVLRDSKKFQAKIASKIPFEYQNMKMHTKFKFNSSIEFFTLLFSMWFACYVCQFSNNGTNFKHSRKHQNIDQNVSVQQSTVRSQMHLPLANSLSFYSHLYEMQIPKTIRWNRWRFCFYFFLFHFIWLLWWWNRYNTFSCGRIENK